MNKKQNILVTGNGFDLYHGLKTTYADFIAAADEIAKAAPETLTETQRRIADLCQNNGFFKHFQGGVSAGKDWTGFEAELSKVIRVFIDFFRKMEQMKNEDPQFDITHYSIFCDSFTFYELTIFKQFFALFEQIYDDLSGGLFKVRPAYITAGRELDKKALIGELRRELDCFTEALGIYLSAPDIAENAAPSEIISAISADYVINLNFTDTYRIYGIRREQVFYAKGNCQDPASMILGIPDDSEDDLDFIFFKNYFQSIIRFTGIPDKNMLAPQDADGSPIPVTTHFFGCSLTPGDEALLRKLEAASAQMVIYYTDSEDYAGKVINLIKLFGKDYALEKIQTREIVFQQIPS